MSIISTDNVKIKQGAKVDLDLLLIAPFFIATIVMLGWLLWRSRFGVDFTDESFYLVWISNPWIYEVSVTQFGYFYHPLYKLVGGDVALLRQGNILITFGLAWLLSALFCRCLSNDSVMVGGRGSSSSIIGISAVLASTSMVFFSFWLPTPSYNSLALQSLLVAASGMLLAEANASRASILGWMLIGLAGWLAFMAKPTTAAALGCVVGFYLLLAGKVQIRLVAISLATVTFLLAASAWAIDGSILDFIARLNSGVQFAEILTGGNALSSLLRLDNFVLEEAEKVNLAVASLLVFSSVWLFSCAKLFPRMVGFAIALFVLLGAVAVILGLYSPQISPVKFQRLLICAAPLGGVVAVLAAWRIRSRRFITRNGLALCVSFLVFPHVYAFGTNNNYWETGSNVSFFWVLAGIALMSSLGALQKYWQVILPVAAVAQAITVVLIYVGMEHPYRQTQPLNQHKEVISVGKVGSKLVLSENFADYIRALDQLAISSGFRSGTPIIDLTGHYPGALYALNAKSIGQAWMVGGYKGSENLARAALDRVSCQDISSSWILVEPAGPRKLRSELLGRYGIDINRDYKSVGRLDSPTGAYPMSYEQHLMSPTRSLEEARIACETARLSSQ